MRKLDRLAEEKFGGDVKEAIKYTMCYYSKAEINKHWGEWTEEEQRYAAMVEREYPNRRFIREILYRMLCLISVPIGIGVLVLDAVLIYNYGAIYGILAAVAEFALVLFVFRKNVKYTDVILVVIMIVLVIASLIALVLSEAIREGIIFGIDYLKSL